MKPGFGKILALLVAAWIASGSALGQSAAPAGDKARIIFARLTQNLGKNSVAEIYEIVDQKPRFLARLDQGDKLVLETTPGRKQYMTMGYTPQQLGGPIAVADLLFADLRGGSTYASMLRFHYGTGGFIPEPVRADRRYRPGSSEVLEAIASGREVKLGSGAAARSEEMLQARFERMSAAYAKKGPDRLAERTIRPEDVLK
jgi:hypothetical protein